MRISILISSILIFISCNKDNGMETYSDDNSSSFISAVDISSYPEIAATNPVFYDLDGMEKDFLTILKENGVNTVRLRLWVNPVNQHSGFDEVKQFSKSLKQMGFKIWLCLHYSDTWADPGKQETPSEWKELDFNSLKDSVYQYTKRVVNQIQPQYIQIGNEINSGILHPYGDISSNPDDFVRLIQAGISAVRENSDDGKIILHYAGIEHAIWFFDQVSEIDYDIIGLSFYPIWHGKSLDELETTMRNLSETNNKPILIAETAYPFTLEWNDWTNNIVGTEDQLILPEYPATSDGQRKFIRDIKALTQNVEKGIGICYWGAELIAWKGEQATDASPWENQALFNFDNEALPVLREFMEE